MHNLNDASKQEIDRFLDKISKYENPFKIHIVGHSDYTGSDAINIKVSSRRAKQCAEYLKEKTNNKYELIIEWKGEHQPMNDCTDETPCEPVKRGYNRRVEFMTIDL